MSLAFSSTLLTTIWGQGIVFIWLIKTIGISTLVTWTSIGIISIRFRQAYKAQGLSLSDLPYQQPLYPLLPITVIVLGIMMSIALGYSSVIQEPFDIRVSKITFKISFLESSHFTFLEYSCDICYHSAVYYSILRIYGI